MEDKKNYRLSSDAVETLANSDGKEAPRYSEEELRKYRSKKAFHIPEWLKMIFVKLWFYGAVCFFFIWGLGNYLKGIDMLFVAAVAMGMVTDLLLNNVIRFLDQEPGDSGRWLMVTAKGMGGFLLNLLYGFLLMLCVYTAYDLINRIIIGFTGDTEAIYLGVEPILFGCFSMGFDMLLIGMKRLLKSILDDAKAKAAGPNADN